MMDSPDTQLHKLLTGVELGDRRSSQLIHHMRSLARTRIVDNTIRIKWLDPIPQQTRRMQLLIKNQMLDELAAVTDEIHQIIPGVCATYTSRSSLPRHHQVGCRPASGNPVAEE